MFKTDKVFLLLLSVPFFFSPVNAEEQTYRQVTDISDEEWDFIGEKKHEYNGCLGTEMIKQVENGSDARAVADKVLDVCSVHLKEMQGKMDANNIQPEFTQQFVYNTKNKAARKMLGGIMMMMAQRQAQAEAAANQQTQEEASAAAE